jgi:hypothetical protein
MMGRDTAGRSIVKARESLRCVPTDDATLQEEFTPFGDDTGVVATEGSVESLRGRMSEAGRQVENLFESLLAQSFAAG